MNINFKIPEESIWWRPAYWPYKNRDIFVSIEVFNELILEHKNKFQNDLLPYYKFNYVYSCLKGENNIDKDVNLNDIEKIITNNISQNRQHVKIRNFYNAVDYIYPDPFIFNTAQNEFTIELAKYLHLLIGKDLWDNSGQYRTHASSPFQDNYEYSKPEEIDQKMDSLFSETRNLMFKNKTIDDRVRIGAMFFSMFLDIHPFSNGNGRVARLLLSLILSYSCTIPVCLFLNDKSRNIYLNCLRESRMNSSIFNPSALSAYILESVLKNIEQLIDFLDLWPKFSDLLKNRLVISER